MKCSKDLNSSYSSPPLLLPILPLFSLSSLFLSPLPPLPPPPLPQEVVPDELIELYISMTDQLRAQLVDSDLPFHCAYSLPAVALTLGRDHWQVLKSTFTLLATDMQVRANHRQLELQSS